jgi:LCP family protein required for cell wall assembly
MNQFPLNPKIEDTHKTKTKNRLDEFQAIPIRRKIAPSTQEFEENPIPLKRKQNKITGVKIIITLVVFVLVYFLGPIRTNILILGTDYLPPRDPISRTDTNIVVTIIPLKPFVAMLSIPRDLWVNIPGVGENRINTAYFFAELNKKGTGPAASMQTIQENFGLTLNYFIVIKMEGVIRIIDSLGGVEVDLPETMGGLEKGAHLLNGTQALAFARERYSADDFSRMAQGQILIKAILNKIISPAGWIRIPMVLLELFRAIDTNIPFWMFPRLSLAVLRAGSNGIVTQIIDREMVTPFTTFDGAQVLAPNWQAINPILLKLFGQ